MYGRGSINSTIVTRPRHAPPPFDPPTRTAKSCVCCIVPKQLWWVVSSDQTIYLRLPPCTEEALPTYMNMLNTLEGTKDATGASESGWAQWTRGWTAEENRHGDLMNKYLWLTGKVDLKPIESTIQNLIGSGGALHQPAPFTFCL